MNKAPAPARARNPKVPDALEQIINELLEKDRTLRYSSAAELRVALERLQAGLIPGAPRRRHLPLVPYALVAATAIVIALGGFFVVGSSTFVHLFSRIRTPSSSPTSRTPPLTRFLTIHCAKGWLRSWNNPRS